MLGSVQQPHEFWPTAILYCIYHHSDFRQYRLTMCALFLLCGMYFIEIPVNYQLLICAVAGSLICEGFADELFVD